MLRFRVHTVVVPVALMLVQAGCHRLPASSYEKKFDSASWKDEASWSGIDRPTPRQQMLGDLVNNVLPGKSRAEVLEILGPPSQAKMTHAADLVWCLGIERGLFGIDSEWLFVWFDSAGVVSRTALGHD